jgi:hypothetical protein
MVVQERTGGKEMMEIKCLNDIRKIKPAKLERAGDEEIRRALNKPFRKPNTDTIYCGVEFAGRFQWALKDYDNNRKSLI